MTGQAMTKEQGRAEVILRKEQLAAEEKAMQEQKSKQELTHYYEHTFTLRNGLQIKICTSEAFNEKDMLDTSEATAYYKIKGFIKNPLLVEKSIEISCLEVAAIETIKDPCIAQVIPWPEEVDIEGTDFDGNKHHALDVLKPIEDFKDFADNKHPNECDCEECKVLSTSKTIAEHKSNCAIHNNPPRGFSSEVTQCDCGAIVRCDEDKLVEDMTTKELIEDK